MPPPASLELPPVGTTFILSYDQNDTDYPIIAIVRDPRQGDGQTVPELFTPHPNTAKYPNHVFVGSTTQSLQTRSLWTYRILPGPDLIGTGQSSDGLQITIEKQEVRTGTGDPSTGFLTLESSVIPKDEAVAVESITTTASYPPTTGQVYLPGLNITNEYVETTIPNDGSTDIGNPATDVSRLDYERSRARTFDITQIQAAMLAFYRTYVVYGTLDVPPVMHGISAEYVKSFGSGSGNSSGLDTTTRSFQYSIDIKGEGNAESNVSCIPELIEDISYTWGKQLPFTVVEFFVAGATATESECIARILALTALTVNPSIKFNPQEITGYTTGQNVRMSARAAGSYNFSAWKNTEDNGSAEGSTQDVDKNYSVENNTRVITYPPCLHDSFTISGGSTDSQALAITATAAIQAGSVDAGFTATANGAVHFTISATSPTALPSSGLYLYDLSCEGSDYGTIKVVARIFDFANLPA